MRLNQILRSLAKMPLFTSVAVLTLAIGIGANTAIFSVIEGVLLKPLPYPRSDELVVLDHTLPGINLPRAGAAPFLYFTYREDGQVFQDVGLVNSGTVGVTGLAEPEEVRTLFVTDGILPMLGVQPALGRLFSRADDTPGGTETVVLSAGYWRSKFGADRAAIGRMLMVDGRPREIIGVLPDTFRFLDQSVSLVLPYRFDRSKVFLGQFSFTGIARLKPGTTIAQASADVARMIPISLTRFPPFPGGNIKMFEEARLTPSIRSLKDDLVGDVQKVLWVLMGTIGMVLLIACANVANLLLVRAESRQQELAIRAALGAGANRIARELLLESVTLGILGGVVGLALAFGALKLLVALAPGNLPRIADITVDIPVLRLHPCAVRGRRSAVWCDPGVQVRRRPTPFRPARRRRANRYREPRAPSCAQYARRHAGCARARAPGQLRPDDPNVPGAEGDQSRVRATRRRSDLPAVDSRLAGERRGGRHANAPRHHGQGRNRTRRSVDRAHVDRHHVRGRLARSDLRAGSHVYGISSCRRFACSSSSPRGT